MSGIGDIIVNYRMICDYFRRPKAAEETERLLVDYNKALVAVAEIRVNNEWCAKWIAISILAFLVFYGGGLVVSKTLRIGTFLALVRLTILMGTTFASAYRAYQMMDDAYLPMRSVQRFRLGCVHAN